VYLAGLAYAGVRSYSLFASTIDAWLLPLAAVGIVALELTAIALPLAIHFWTAPGAQRMAAMSFYVLDLALIATNAVLDAAHHSGAEVAGILAAYGAYIVPALPLLCMAGWSLIWMLDPSSRERDMRESVKAATHEALLAGIKRAVEETDISQAVEVAAGEAARALVGETLGAAPRRQPQLPATSAGKPRGAPQSQAESDELERYFDMPEAMPATPTSKNGHRPKVASNGADPK